MDRANYPARLIEVDLPIKRISEHARREKSIRHGHISTLHIWWARRPLAACRAVICAALWPDPADELCPQPFRDEARKWMHKWANQYLGLLGAESYSRFIKIQHKPALLDDNVVLRRALLDFIADFANWDNSAKSEYLETSRALTEAAHVALGGEPGTRPLVADPFAGGGAIPLEALRVGADTFASDLNPVAVLLNKIILEYIPRYGPRLADEVRKCGEYIKQEAEKELLGFFPRDDDGSIPIAYIWARTLISGAPGHSDKPVEVPLLRSMWLAKKGNRKIALRWVRGRDGIIQTRQRDIHFADGVTRSVLQPLLEVFHPHIDTIVEPGTSRGGSATCPITGFTTNVEGVRAQLATRRGGANDARLCAVVINLGEDAGRSYRIAGKSDEAAVERARQELERRLASESQPVSVPMGEINHLRGFFNIVLYGMKRWGDLFSPRQMLVITTFGRLVAQLRDNHSMKSDIGTAIQTCLALAVDRLADKLSSVTRWDVTRENPQGTFGRQALPMVWDYCEINPFSGSSGDWSTAVDWIVRVIETNGSMSEHVRAEGRAEQSSATVHPLPDDSVNAIITDPPYYAAVPYADLSDFFYSWLKQTIGNRFPSMFAEPLTPKSGELVSLAHRAAMYREKDGPWFEARMAEACKEARRICRPDGIGVYVFANKETKGWEAMLAALINSGSIITASWPVDTEMASRLRAQGSAALASSIHLVCRPRENLDGLVEANNVGDWRDVLQELPIRIHEWMPRLAAEGVVGADAIFACLGPALEIFSRYSRVEKASGEQVTLREYLEHVWAAVSREALNMIFAEADATGFEEDARLTAMWLWTLGAGGNGQPEHRAETEEEDEDEDSASSSKAAKGGFSLEFDAARKIAQGLGAHLEQLDKVIEVKGDKARLLAVSERAKYLFGKGGEAASLSKPRQKQKQIEMFDLGAPAEGSDGWGDRAGLNAGETTLDRVHQSMLLFAAGRSEALKRLLVEAGVGRDPRFWRLAQALSALYPPSSEEKRWVDGVLARKKGLGF